MGCINLTYWPRCHWNKNFHKGATHTSFKFLRAYNFVQKKQQNNLMMESWDILNGPFLAQIWCFDFVSMETRILRKIPAMLVESSYFALTLCKNPKKSNDEILKYFEKGLFLGQIWPFNPIYRWPRIFSQKSSSITFLQLLFPKFIPKIRKS